MANQGLLRLYRTSGPANLVGNVAQCLFRVLAGPTPTPLLELATANVGVALKNSLFVSGNTDGTESISPSADVSTAESCRFQQNAPPNNFATIFPAASNVTFSRTAPALDENDVALHLGGASDVDGIGVASVVGSLDVHGRPFLGGAWDLGSRRIPPFVRGRSSTR